MEAKVVKVKLKVDKEGKGKGDSKKSTDSIPPNCRMARAGKDSLIEFDSATVTFEPSKVRFAGYDKQINAHKESFHVINDSQLCLRKVKIKIVYKDMKGRMLHSRFVAFPCYIPAGETRKIDISSWDTQNSFYYHLSNEPKKDASPYKVEIFPQFFILSL